MQPLQPYDPPPKADLQCDAMPIDLSNESSYKSGFKKMLHFEEIVQKEFVKQFDVEGIRLEMSKNTTAFRKRELRINKTVSIIWINMRFCL